MPVTINADTGAVTGITGLVQTADNTGNLALQANGVTVLTVTTSNAVAVTGAVSATGNVTGGNLNLTGNLVDTGALGINTGSNGNLTLNAGTGFIIASSGILNGQANGTGNIGNATGYFNTVFARATSAQYADLAEMYVADADYAPGTVVEFGGNQEVCSTSSSHTTRIAGVISTNPSYLMNATQTGEHAVAVALVGRVPCLVTGTIHKGDRLVASDQAGVATVLDPAKYEPGCIIGKALESHQGTQVNLIEIAVGRN
jgi:hypothetical protein